MPDNGVAVGVHSAHGLFNWSRAGNPGPLTHVLVLGHIARSDFIAAAFGLVSRAVAEKDIDAAFDAVVCTIRHSYGIVKDDSGRAVAFERSQFDRVKTPKIEETRQGDRFAFPITIADTDLV